VELLGKDDVEMGGQKGLASATQWSAQFQREGGLELGQRLSRDLACEDENKNENENKLGQG